MKQTTEQIAHSFLAYLRNELRDPTLDYADELTQLQGGYEAQSYRFALRGGQDRLPGPLVLRLYPARFGTENARWESTVQRVLAGRGYPVPEVYLTCTNLDILGGAFFVMAFLPGQTLMSAPPETMPVRLGKTHAALHQLDPMPLIEAFTARGIVADSYRLERRLQQLRGRVTHYPWLQTVVDWLFAARPPEPACLAICQGDFHPLNILVAGDRVTAVLDWPNFLLADPVLDVATTFVITTIPAKYLTADWPGFADVDWDQVGQQYLAAYEAEQPLDRTNLAYYRVHRAVHALLEGTEGQAVWQHPLVMQALMMEIRSVTGLAVAPSTLQQFSI